MALISRTFFAHLHASVNYAQYPLMSYMPSVAGTIYKAPPGRATKVSSIDDCMLISVRGPSDNTPLLLNGDAEPGPIELKQGVRYRLRFINITPHDPLLTVSLLVGSSPVAWRAIAKDGADLPVSQATERPARQTVSVGETYDFEFEPRSATELWLEVFRPARAASAQSQIVVPVHVH